MKLYKFNDFLNEGGIALNKEQAIEFVNNKSKEKGYEFRGFVDDIWKGKDTKLILYCPKHDLEWKTSSFNNFKRDKTRCPLCSKESSSKLLTIPEEEALKKINKKCKERNYQFIGFVDDEWKGKNTYLKLKCNKHGTWKTTSYDGFIYSDRGCPKCGLDVSKNSKRFSEDKAKVNIINKCKEKGYNFLGFVGGKYINNKTKLILSCPKHGKWDKASYNGLINFNQGCPICNESKGAAKISEILDKYGFISINMSEYKDIKDKKLDKKYYIREFIFNDCRSRPTFDRKRTRFLPFDFYLPNYNLCIEYDGQQHYEPKFGYNKEDVRFKMQQENDKIKNEYCSGENGRPTLIRIPYTKFNNIEDILIKKLNL